MPLAAYRGRAALVVAHPSHELRVHGWLEQTRPYVCILTDGSGRSGVPQLSRTSEVLSRVGATQGAIYGRLTDLEVYSAIIGGDSELFAGVVEELAQAFVAEQIEYVVGDAAEGYNVAHDICRVMIDAAVECARQKHDHHLANFNFPVVGAPGDSHDDEIIRLELDADAFGRKVNAVSAYSPKLAHDIEATLRGAPFQGIRRFSEPQLTGEVDVELRALVLEELESWPALKEQLSNIIEDAPLDVIRIECLRAVDNKTASDSPTNGPLFYELYGEKLVAAGHYEKVIRYREHMLPLAQAIRARTEREEHCVRSAS